MSNSEVLKQLWISEEDYLQQVRDERTEWDDFSYDYKLEIEADLKLLKNKRDKKKDEKLVWDSTLFNSHTALVARSFQSRNQIKLKADKAGAEREVKMLNAALNEDMESAAMKALRYYIYYDKFATGVAIVPRIGWDGVYKRNIFSTISPLTWIPDPQGDYFTGNYRYTGFYSIKTRQELEAEGYDVDEISNKSYAESAQDKRERQQRIVWLAPEVGYLKDVFDVYLHFTHVNGVKVYSLSAGMDSTLLKIGICTPNSPTEEKHPESIRFPLAFYYWKPDRDNPFWDRPANYIRDIQLQKAEIANLRLNKMRAELYPMYLFNKDFVSSKDLAFGFNKGIPVSTGLDGASVNLSNIVAPIQKDLRVDTSFAVEQSLDRQVEKSTSLGEVIQGTIPGRRETLGTNQLVQSNTDVNLSLNEEIHNIGDEQFIAIWFGGYYQNFSSWDKKLVFAGSSTAATPMVLRKSDFIYEGNLSISIESNIASEERKRKEAAASIQLSWLILPSVNQASKVMYLRHIADRAGMPAEAIEEVLIDTPSMMKQRLENEALKENVYVDIDADDNDEEHLVAMGANIDTEAFEAHKLSHIMAIQQKGKMTQAPLDVNAETAKKSQEFSMQNSMTSQAMAQAGSELQQ